MYNVPVVRQLFARTLFGLCAVAAPVTAQMAPPDALPAPTERKIDIAPGRASSTILRGAPGDEGMPVTVIRGLKPGPTLAIVATTRGGPGRPIPAFTALRERATPDALAGTLVLVEVSTPTELLDRPRIRGPWVDWHISRLPGLVDVPARYEARGGETVPAILDDAVLANSDYVVALHAAEGPAALQPMTFWRDRRMGAVDSVALDLALAFGNQRIVTDPEPATDRLKALVVQEMALQHGAPAITTVSSTLWSTEPKAVARNAEGPLRVMRHLGMLNGEVVSLKAPVWIDRTYVVQMPHVGEWRSTAHRNDAVGKQSELGRVASPDPDGSISPWSLVSPFAGIVLDIQNGAHPGVGEPVVLLGRRGVAPR